MILGLTAAVTLSAYLAIRRVPNVYESRAVVVVADRDDGGLVTSGQIAAITEQLTSRAVLEPIIEKFGLYRPIVETGRMDAAVAQMRKAISVETKLRRDFPESLAVTYRYTDAETTRAVLADLVSRFDEANAAVRHQAEDEVASLNAEIASIDRQLDDLDHERAASAAQTAASRREFEAMQATRARRDAAAASIETLTSRQQSLTAEIAGLEQQVKDQEALVASLPASPEPSGAAGALYVRRAELAAQLDAYTKQYTNTNPKVVAARGQLAEVEGQLSKLEGASGDPRSASPAAAELRGLKRDLTRAKTELQITSAEIDRRQKNEPAIPVESPLAAKAEPLAPEADAGYDRLRIRYQALMTRQDALQRALPAALVGDGVFRVVDPPSKAETPVGPNRWLLAAFGLGLALAVALLAAAALEARRVFRIQDDLDVAYFLGAPVLALIPETLTPDEGRRRRSTRLARGLAAAAGAVALVPALFALLSVLRVFELLSQR